ncbi:MAG: hypothetical protein DDT26_01750 [Dehalococcoidia bacterium]|nr:hypothetical protein [Chloroflexota bacterium]
MSEIREKLQNPGATFSRDEMYAIFEELSEDYGFYRSKDLPQKDKRVETASLIVKGFEDLGPIVVRPMTVQDTLINLPSWIDKILGDNLDPSKRAYGSAATLAIARLVVVSPPNLVSDMLASENPNSVQFFYNFAEEYSAWREVRLEEVREKKSGAKSGTKSASSSETSETSSPQTPRGFK